MIISHKHRFIYLKSVKTASTSTEVMLSKYCGKRDVLTSIYPAVEGHQERNNDLCLGPHISMRDLQKSMNLESIPYPEYRIFLNVRNPWDRAVSYYYHYKDAEHDPIKSTFKEWVITNYKFKTEQEKNKRSPHLKYWYKHKGMYILSNFIRFENIIEDSYKVLLTLGIKEENLQLLKCKFNNLRNRDYKSYYDQETAKLIKINHQEEINLFNYEKYNPYPHH